MKYINEAVLLMIAIVLTVTVSGCGIGDKIEASVTGSSIHCEDGVEYIQFARGASVAYNTDGTIKLCK